MLNLKVWTAVTERHTELGIVKTFWGGGVLWGFFVCVCGFFFFFSQNLRSSKDVVTDHSGSSLQRLFY